ncbi:hypothetical protein E4U19_006953, partial [Claviceps sp. Clav32 group G5]
MDKPSKYRRRREVGHEADENAGKTWAAQHGPTTSGSWYSIGCREPRWVGNLAYRGKVQELLWSRGFTLHLTERHGMWLLPPTGIAGMCDELDK